jgi:hypothetical protein
VPFPPPKKKKGDFALLLAEPKEKPRDPSDDAEPDEDGDDFAEMDEGGEEDPLAALDDNDEVEGDDSSGIDPEQAALCETLGFTDPEQQQALIDLVKLVTSPADPMSSDSGSAPPPLPESTY